MATEPPTPRGRQAEARRNDARILQSALAVFETDPEAPMSAVARAAGVGQATLYRRYPSRQDLLEAVAAQGVTAIADAAAAAAVEPDPGRALAEFLDWYTRSGALRIEALLGMFAPSQKLLQLAHQANDDMAVLVRRAAGAGALRSDVTGADLTLLVGWLATLARDGDRGEQLRRRYLTLLLQALGRTDAAPLPGPAPDADELEEPWRKPTPTTRTQTR